MPKNVKGKSKKSKPRQAAAKKAKAKPKPSRGISKPKLKPAPIASVPPQVALQENVTITKAKGRPMLSWVGKRPLHSVTAFPAQHVESFTAADADKVTLADKTIWKDWPERYPQGGLLFHGDNKEVLAHLLANGFRGKVQLIYIDPPFDSGADYVRKVSLRGVEATTKIEGESYALGEQIQYTDIWTNDNYLQFMYERLLLLKSLLAENGGLFLHCDWKRIHLLRCLLDEVFGPQSFKNEIVRVKCNPKNSRRKAFGNVHDCVLFYTNGASESRTWHQQREEVDSEDLERLFERVDPQTKRRYTTVALHARGTRSSGKDSGKPWRGLPPPSGRHWAYLHSQLDQFDAAGLIEWSSTGNPRLIRFADEKEGDLVQDIWTMKDPEEDEYPTEKPEELLVRIIRATSNPGDIVLDCFIGSGTAAAVAQQVGRRWIGCDINKGSIQTTTKRLQDILTEQVEEARNGSGQQHLLPDETAKAAPPAQLCFTVWRVNDYDLAVQHNEAVNLACEHIGVTRMLGDGFFDGTWGKKLVKIVPFGHPLSPADLEDVKRELDIRQKESRDVVMVCLGKELSVDAWLADYNRVRRQGDAPNKIEVIELRSDPKYGKFIEHKRAQARVDIRRMKDKSGEYISVEIKDFISPSIVERLQSQAGLLAPKIPDWRAMVDSVMIDSAYGGKAFNVALADVPERKQDYVKGIYKVLSPSGSTTVVAVKITDMLGEEVLVSKEI